MKGKPRNVNLLLLLILIVGLLLRFWRFWEIPFTYDELSALSRLQFNNFSDLIKLGVKPDGHPAGVQVFLFYWTRLFGESEIVVKGPFLLAGMLSIFVTYRIGRLWFNNTVGILSALYISSLQFTVMYSQIARPYVSGLLLTLLMVLYWSKFFFEGNKVKHLLLFVVFASLSTYNHHFSLLFAAVVGFTGLMFINRKNYLVYILSGFAILILYVPHLSIFFSQLDVGGIGSWLNKPSPFFLFEFLNFLFHFSPFVWIVLIAVGVIVVFGRGESPVKVEIRKKRIILLLWFFAPLVIGYAYSVVVNPVLQYSMLIFSTPYLFLFLFSWAKNISVLRLAILVFIISIVNIASLIWGRQYYKIFYKQAYEQAVKHAVDLQFEFGKNSVFLVDDYIPYYNEYYFKKYKALTPYYTVRNKSLNINDFRKVVDGIETNIVVTSGIKPDYFQLVKEKFPYLIDYDYGFTQEQYTFVKEVLKGETQILSKYIASIDFGKNQVLWKVNKKHVAYDSLKGTYVFHMKSGLEYGPGITLPLSDISKTRHLFVDIHARIKILGQENKASIVTVIKKGKETLFWKAMNFSEFEAKKGEWTDIYLTVDLLLAVGQKEVLDNCTFKTFVWNPNNIDFFIDQFNIVSRPGNPYRYSLFYDIKD